MESGFERTQRDKDLLEDLDKKNVGDSLEVIIRNMEVFNLALEQPANHRGVIISAALSLIRVAVHAPGVNREYRNLLMNMVNGPIKDIRRSIDKLEE